jgi:hypothetical protein
MVGGLPRGLLALALYRRLILVAVSYSNLRNMNGTLKSGTIALKIDCHGLNDVRIRLYGLI